MPGKKLVYAVKMEMYNSTRFSDCIEADLMQVEKNKIKQLTLKDYSINERTGSVQQRDVLVLNKDGDNWQGNKMSSKQEVDKTNTNDILKTLDELNIVGVRTKPEGLTQSLKKSGDGVSLSTQTVLSLQSKGYYFTRDGQLMSNEGELQARTEDGVIYTLRFGEIVYGTGLTVTAGTETAKDDEKETGENRYLFITTTFDAGEFTEPTKPKNREFITKADSLWTDADKKNKELENAHNAWQRKIDNGQKLSDELNARFARWYYVISSESFDKLNLSRKDLIKEKKKDT